MGALGLKYVAWAKQKTEPADAVPTYETGLVIGKAVSANLTVTRAEGELYADDLLAEYVSEFSSADLSLEVDNISLYNQALLYGATYKDNELQHHAADTPPYGGIGGVQVLLVHGEKKYRAYVFVKGKASVPDWSGQTKGSSITIGTQPLNLKLMSPNYGAWYYIKEFTNEESAKAYVDTKLNLGTYHAINIQVNGAADGESVSHVGTVYVASGSAFELGITGTPTALYDNGMDSVINVANNKYTLSAVSADHNIAVIF